ncbi:hypothetical protein P12x_003321 [Tundrisphaera lichenicola]|uniref:hypothetical protein n=1 Tax=Tundrisphaera lichenicola TaxID=2029860 RepID=UPI003EB83B0F
MNDPTRHNVPLYDQLQESISGKVHTTRAGANFRWYQAIVQDLEAVRLRLDEAIVSCARRESQSDRVVFEEGGRIAHHHLTEIDSLGRLRNQLDRLVTRFRASFTAGIVPEVAGSARRIDLELAECVTVMKRRFQQSDVRHDFQADLASDLGLFERLLDDFALMHSDSENQHHQGGNGPTRGESTTGRTAHSPENSANSDPGGSPSQTLREYSEVLREVDRRIIEAQFDPPLQGFWRGVKQKFREELARISRPMVLKPISFSKFDS